MSKHGHLITAAALAYVVYERSASPVLAIGTLLGSSFPDIGELARFYGRWRASLIPHRTLTHWIPLYVVILAALPSVAPHMPWWIASIIKGVCFGSLLHIALDFFSPAGVPILNPFGTRKSAGFHHSESRHPYLYRTGTVEEAPIIAITVVGLVALLAPHPAPYSLGMFISQSINVLISFIKG